MQAGYYLIGLGEVCADNNAGRISTTPPSRQYTFTVSNAPPAAVCLFGSALMGFLGVQKLKMAAYIL